MHANEMILETVEARQEFLFAITNIVFTLGFGTIIFAIAALHFLLLLSLGSGDNQTVHFPLLKSSSSHNSEHLKCMVCLAVD